jgi:hypothetical protein
VHAKGDEARAFYEHFNFEASPSDLYHLLLIMRDLVAIIAERGFRAMGRIGV